MLLTIPQVTEKVGNDWGYSWTWTLRAGSQTIEQHEYCSVN
jgi:hypothetical protein